MTQQQTEREQIARHWARGASEMGTFIVVRDHPENLHRRFMGVSVREVGPRHTEFDYVCWIAKFWRFYFIVNHHWSWSLTRIRFEWWPRDHSPARSFINRTIRSQSNA